MPTNRTPLRRRRDGLNADKEMELWLGQCLQPAFESEQERHATWVRYRNWVMAKFANHGRRPDAWWRYEAPVPRPRDRDLEPPLLYRLGLLSEDELAVLMFEWRAQFDKAQQSEFEFCIGHKKRGDTFATFLEGSAARRAHYKWACIPPELVKQWSEERRRRTRTNLQAHKQQIARAAKLDDRRDGGTGEAVTRPVAVIRRTTRN
jgi:hypothetical protein